MSNTKTKDAYSGCVSTIIFSNTANDYSVLILRLKDQDLVITGSLSDCEVGDYIYVSGHWVDHPVHKKQFKVTTYEHLVPRTPDELMLFLSSGVISGIGPHFAEQLVQHFGEKLIYVLDKDPDQLSQVAGIGAVKIRGIVSSWTLHREQLAFLQYVMQFDVDIKLAKRIWGHYYGDAFDVCQNNPYQMIGVIRGVDFRVSDRIAANNLDLRLSDARISAVIIEVFHQYYRTSNVWMLYETFFQTLSKQLNIEDSILTQIIQQKMIAQDIAGVTDGDGIQWVAPRILSDGECRIMDGVQQLSDSIPMISIAPQDAVEWFLTHSDDHLSQDQLVALEGLLSDTVSILYGGPGTGKTTLLKSYVHIVAKKTNKIVCMAPTGKAAKRLAEQIGRRASTIHSMMEYDETNHTLTPRPLDCEVCIIDEMSMVDMLLFQDVLQMLPKGVRLVMVGDPDQLPSIGPGQVFNDMIQRSAILKFQLTTNHRQVSHQGITSLAQCILGRNPIDSVIGQDLTFIPESNPDQLEALIYSLFTDKIPTEHSCSLHDIQLLVPIHKGRFGIDQLNTGLTNRIRPMGMTGQYWAVGDRVMQCRNNYSKHVMNGDIGYIRRINNSEVAIQFDARIVTFQLADMDDIKLAYAVSVHKFQGSESSIIILPIIRQWKFFMSMDVLYTAVTRAKDHLYIIGEMDTFNSMIINSKKADRITKLWCD